MQITNQTSNIISKPCLLYLSIIALMNTAAAAIEDTTLPSTTIAPIVIVAKKDIMQPEQTAHDVYDNDESSTFATQEDIERFMGESPSDIFKGMVGVQSGDARNSGAIGPNVRGIQGQGRVPVTIDGTEQAITV